MKVAIIQARMGSTRLPGKVLRRLAGKSVLEHVITRVRGAKNVERVVVATTISKQDDPIVAECERLGTAHVRGSEEDVLSRYHAAAKRHGASVVVRVTSDCPLFDGGVLDRMLAEFDADYMSNCLRRTFPRGLDAEVFTMDALDRANSEAKEKHEREHVTPYIYGHPEKFRLQSYEEAEDHSHLRWTLDTPEDWKMIEAVYAGVSPKGEAFRTADVLKFLRERPEIAMMNAQVEQKSLRG
jgi:spore coat polysaccharide biosynthesis protein SpsF